MTEPWRGDEPLPWEGVNDAWMGATEDWPEEFAPPMYWMHKDAAERE